MNKKSEQKSLPGIYKSKTIISCLIALFCLLMSANICAQSKELKGTEYGIKAAYLYNFLKYIDWEEEKNPVSGDSIKIIVFGNYPFKDAFDHLKGKSIRGKKLYILKVASIKELSSCNILYISISEQNNISNILKSVRKSGTLTVGETEEFLKQKGMVGFFMENESVKFAINPELCKSEGIELNPQLLSTAKIVSY